MQVLILCVLLTVMVAGAWLSGRAPEPEAPAARSVGELLAEAGTAEHISRAVDALRAVMEHPELGGPGVLTVQFPPCGQPEVLAQYPNIRGTLYRRIVRGELEELRRLGVPEALLAGQTEFSTESGGMVLLLVRTGGLTPALERQLADRRGRAGVLRALAGTLGERYPDLAVRIVGGDLLLTARPGAGQRARP